MAILVTGFEPFGPVRVNPSAAILERLPPAVAGREIATAVLPVDTERVQVTLRELYAQGPEAVLHLGVARERGYLAFERRAVNRLDFDIPDNAGQTVRGRPVLEGAPAALASRLPEADILAAWADRGLPGRPSDDAGTYLCNQTFFLALSWLPPATPVGFVHVPADEALEPDGPHLVLAKQVEGVRLAVAAIGAALAAPVQA